MSKRLALALCALATCSLLAWTAPSSSYAETQAEAADVGGPFMLIDQNGDAVSDENYRGAFLLITFGYTHCPDVCPTTLMTIASALNALGPQAKPVRPIFISLDPTRDTPERLKEYVEAFGDNFVGLTGPEAYIANVARKYHISFSKAPSSSGDYTIDHTAGIFLVGPDGVFIRRFGYDTPARDLAAQLKQLIQNKSE